jgi:hypothetical protein
VGYVDTKPRVEPTGVAKGRRHLLVKGAIAIAARFPQNRREKIAHCEYRLAMPAAVTPSLIMRYQISG